jgi:hypothetical protein
MRVDPFMQMIELGGSNLIHFLPNYGIQKQSQHGQRPRHMHVI